MTKDSSDKASVLDDDGAAVTAINSQIEDTLKALNESATADSGALVTEADAKARVLARNLARQDAVAHLRRTQILSEAALSAAVAAQAKGDLEAGEAIMKTAQQAVLTAREMLAEVEKMPG